MIRLLSLVVLCLIMGASKSHAQEPVSIVQGFRVFEIDMPHGQVHLDSCGVHAGATDSIDEGLESDWPPSPSGVFDAHWLTPTNNTPRTDLRTPPTAPPYAVDFDMEFQFSWSPDTMVVSWENIAQKIDSISIDDATPGHDPGAFVHRTVSAHGPDVLKWTRPPGIDISHLRFRVYFHLGIVSVGGDERPVPNIGSLSVTPNPARGQLNVAGAGSNTIVISDLLGRELGRVAGQGALTAIPVAGLRPGTYCVTLVDHLPVSRALVIVE